MDGKQLCFEDLQGLQDRHKEYAERNLNSFDLAFLNEIETEMALQKEKMIKSIAHNSLRAFKALPFFFKLPYVKTKPKQLKTIKKDGTLYKEHRVERISFRSLHGKVTYHEGELSDNDRMVYISILNRFIRYIDFAAYFGYLPLSLEQISEDVGISHRTTINKSIFKLQNTEFEYETGDIKYEKTPLLGQTTSMPTKKLKEAVYKDLLILKNPVISEQAAEILKGINPKSPKINCLSLDLIMVKMILDNFVTTVDMWALKLLNKSYERTLFLFLWDRYQLALNNFKKSKEKEHLIISLNIMELSALLDLKLKQKKRGNKLYPDYSGMSDKLVQTIDAVCNVAKFTVWYNIEGQGRIKQFIFQFSITDQRQIPKTIKESKEQLFEKLFN